MSPPLKEGFVILTAVLQHFLYVYNPPNVVETHGCFNRSIEECKWIKFNQSYLYNDELTAVSIINIEHISDHQNVLRYKLRFTFSDDSCGESIWKHQLLTPSPDIVSIGVSEILMFMSSGFILSSILYSLAYCFAKCKLHSKMLDFEMYSFFKK